MCIIRVWRIAWRNTTLPVSMVRATRAYAPLFERKGVLRVRDILLLCVCRDHWKLVWQHELWEHLALAAAGAEEARLGRILTRQADAPARQSGESHIAGTLSVR